MRPAVSFPIGVFMTITEMLEQSGILTLLGMGVVFAFLAVLIIVMNILRIVLAPFVRTGD